MLLFALKTLLFDRGKLLIALVGVVFSIVLVNIQMGLFLGLIRKGSLLVDHAKADIWVGRRGVENVELPHEIPEVWLQRIRGLPEVDAVAPFILKQAKLTQTDGQYEDVFIVGTDPSSSMGTAWNLSHGSPRDLLRPNSISIEELEAWKIGNPEIGDLVEINGHRARIVATTRGVLTFTAAPYLFTNIDAARDYCDVREGYCMYGLVKCKSGADPDDVRDAIRQLIPDADVFTAEEFRQKSRMYWISRTGIGMSFGGATVLGLIVGLVMVSQSTYALTLDHISDYATLKAIGAEERQVFAILVVQVLIVAVLGTAVGLALVAAFNSFLETPMAEIDLPPWLLCSGVAVTFAICMFASILPFLRLRKVDPAVVLQG